VTKALLIPEGKRAEFINWNGGEESDRTR